LSLHTPEQEPYPDHPRNLDDEQLQWVKEVAEWFKPLHCAFCEQEKHEKYLEALKNLENPEDEAALAAPKKEHPPVDVADFVDQIDYIKNKIGIDHVGISSDFDGGGGIEGWADASETFNVTLELVRRGYSEEEIEKIWSGNLLRVLDKTAKVASDLQKAE
jgi:membrane dipeptidase